MHLETKLIPMDERRVVVVVGMGTIGSGSAPLDLSRAKVECLDVVSGESVNLTDACSLPKTASARKADELRRRAKGQYDLAQSARSQSQREMYAQNDQRFRFQAELALKDSRHMPISIERCGADHLLVGFVHSKGLLGKSQGMLRLLNVHTGQIVWEETSNPAHDGGEARGLAELHAVSPDGQRVLVHQLRTMSRFGLGRGRQTIEFGERSLFPNLSEFTRLKSIKMNATSFFASTDAQWLQAMEGDSRGQLLAIEHKSGRISQEIQLKRYPADLATTPDGCCVAIAGTGPTVDILDLNTGKIRSVKPHLGLGRDWTPFISISETGEYVVSLAEHQRRIIRTADLTVATLPDQEPVVLEKRQLEDLDVSLRMQSNLALVGDTLVALDGPDVSLIPLDSLEFKAPSKPPKPIKLDKGSSPEQMLDSAGLNHEARTIAEYFHPGISLDTKSLGKRGWKPATKGGPDCGTTRLGGWPDLPADQEWPEWEGRPMAFLAQVNLAEMHAVESRLRLPATGLLSFFMGCDDESYEHDDFGKECYLVGLMLGTDPQHVGGWKVIYTPDVSAVSQCTLDANPLPQLFKPCICKPKAGTKCLPDEESAPYQAIELKPEEREKYHRLLAKIGGNEDHRWTNQLAGYPTLIQGGPVEHACEMATRGQNPYNLADKKTAKASTRWVLLLQLVSDDNADFLWGDGGHIYFYGDREKMARGDFSETWMYFEN